VKSITITAYIDEAAEAHHTRRAGYVLAIATFLDSFWQRVRAWRGNNAAQKEVSMQNVFTILPRFLRDPDQFFRSVRDNEQVQAKAATLATASFLFLMVYGFTVGLTKSPLQAVSSAIKMPVLFLSTMAFCLPALYFFSLALLSTPLRMIQVLTIVLSGIAVTSFLLLGLAPITLFFVLTSSNYPFFQLLAVGCVGVSALIGVYFLWRGMTLIEPARQEAVKPLGRRILSLWMLLFGFVGTQMTWRLSPFIGKPGDPFYLLKPARDNFYVQAIGAAQQILHLPPLQLTLDTLLTMGALSVVAALVLGLVLLVVLIRTGSNRRRSSAPAARQGA
jgi:hypothetical protein